MSALEENKIISACSNNSEAVDKNIEPTAAETSDSEAKEFDKITPPENDE
ncbi:hypothetical protein AYI69_g8899, partial [Smittium culicis]